MGAVDAAPAPAQDMEISGAATPTTIADVLGQLKIRGELALSKTEQSQALASLITEIDSLRVLKDKSTSRE